MSSKPKSKIWKFFDKKSKSSAECRLCQKIIQISGNTSNLHTHIKTKHLNSACGLLGDKENEVKKLNEEPLKKRLHFSDSIEHIKQNPSSSSSSPLHSSKSMITAFLKTSSSASSSSMITSSLTQENRQEYDYNVNMDLHKHKQPTVTSCAKNILEFSVLYGLTGYSKKQTKEVFVNRHVCLDHMDGNFNDRINILRKRSRLLLAQADRNSKKVKKEIKKLYSQDVTLREYYKNDIDDQNFCYKRHAESWNLRNDSSSVGAALCPDYFFNSLNCNPASMPNISTAKRVLVSSKKKHCDERCFPKSIHRKPVRECYCNPEIKKLQLRSAKTQYKQALPCKHCKSHPDFNPPIAKDSGEKSPLSSSISCETLRRVQNINYAPRSQFLRNVQSKVSLLHATGDCPEVYPRCPCYHELMARKTIPNVDSKCQSRTDKESEINDHLIKSKSLAKVVKSVESNEKDQYSGSDSIDKSNKGVCQVCLKKQARSKNVCKRTPISKKSVADVKKTKSNSKTSAKSKRALQSFQKKCACCPDNKIDNASKTTLEKGRVDAEDYQHTICVNTRFEDIDGEYLSDEEVRELGNFREQNYFDTHGSSHTLQSSKCSGSVEQYLLNDRLFPEPARTTHKKDLVVTMPACATIQRKRMHYFPRYIVRQEKSSCNSSYKKKHCQSCPLTGHAIDLGVTKIRSPLNSLALKYQKRQP